MRSFNHPKSRRASCRALALSITFLVGALTIATSIPAFAGTPPSIMLAALARQEGWDPEGGDTPGHPNLARGIPRDFPVPAASHDLHASNAADAASVTGTPEQAEAFYDVIFPALGWRVKKRLKFAGHITYIACKESQCVNLSSSSPQVDQSNPNIIHMSFFPERSQKQ